MKDVLTRIAAQCPERFKLRCGAGAVALQLQSVPVYGSKVIAWEYVDGRSFIDMRKVADLVDERDLCPLLGNYEGTLAERALRALADKLEVEEEARG